MSKTEKGSDPLRDTYRENRLFALNLEHVISKLEGIENDATKDMSRFGSVARVARRCIDDLRGIHATVERRMTLLDKASQSDDAAGLINDYLDSLKTGFIN